MFGAIAGGIASALAGGAMSKLFGGGQKAASGGIQGDVLATDNNAVGMGDAGIPLLQRIFLMSSLMLLLVWLIFFMVLIKLLPILGTISGKTVKLMVLALICLGNNRQD